jgi:hypothetical protein
LRQLHFPLLFPLTRAKVVLTLREGPPHAEREDYVPGALAKVADPL